MMKQSLKDIFSMQVYERPEHIALTFGHTQMTYEELDKSSNRLANYLLEHGVKKGQLIGFSLDRSPQLIVAILATVKIGCIYVPIDSKYPQERIEFMSDDSGITILITTSSTLEQMPYLQIATVLLDREANQINLTKATPPNINIEPLDLAYIMYTSGSTGTPKGVAIPNQAIIRLVKETNYFQIDHHQTVGHFATTSFDASTFEIWGALLNGAKLAISKPGPITPESVGEIVRDNNVSIMFLTTGLFNLMIDEQIDDLTDVKYLISGGEVMAPHIAKKAVEILHNTQIFNAYGPTENCVFSTAFELTDNMNFSDSIPIGKVINGTSMIIVNEQLNIVDDGQLGELLLGGKGLASGYWNRENLTKEKFISLESETFYRTGDLVRKLPDGNIEYLGRMDQQVKIRGFRIELTEIENHIMQNGDIKRCSVNVQESIPGDKRLVSYLVPFDQKTFDLKKLKFYLKQKMPDYMIPSNYVILDSLPLTNNGKVDRDALSNILFTRPNFEVPYKAPHTEMEQHLVQIWQDILKIDKVGVDDDFFELGGNSLLAARATISMKEVLHTTLPSSVLYKHSTICKISSFINNRSTETYLETLNLNNEIQLEKRISPPTEFIPTLYTQKAIFLTGATGFLGAFLIKEFLEHNEDTDIYCLVRASSAEEGLRRIKNNMEKYGIWLDTYEPKIIPIAGHLDRPMFGLTREGFDQLAKTIDVIYHNGAKVNYVHTYDLHKSANVTGTQTILELACTSILKPVHYLSTISVFGPIGYFTDVKELKEDSDLEISEPFIYKDMGYAQSKWVAENVMWEANKRGIPMTVFRPGFIMGDSNTGVNNTEDYVARMIKGCIQLGTYPHLPRQRKEFVPVNFVAKAIREICLNPNNFGKAYHLTPPAQSIDLEDFFIEINSTFGYSLKEVSYKEWVSQLIQDTKNSSDNALTPFLTLLSEELYKGKTAFELYENMPSYNSINTIKALSESGMTLPVMDKKLLITYFNYMKKIGFISSPLLRV
ncbi:amino acid adenylation domain-containing protein [Alkalicoccobacillus murimartini]|uniref:Amino acid adenylation domain-containing protein/thioester reductase-like protein n=1 Tax=Alkalicoccobacillus murimartini TaxID=171685 RepID=A0ABT9YKF2_9BACI|nr:amino acid adenylation domain-containing protein [Alkalicoccobacillus murimartini]MDQ0208337.1 amino acid adenylation domain-containing protein/thioester reductase-like protein [Alkalicoccobacillus murimartini]